MFKNVWRMTCALSTVVVYCGQVSAVLAQWYPGPAVGNPCRCMQPVTQPCYQQVPVTEYQQVRQVVKRPVIETKYVDQEVTAYRQVFEPRTVDVPTTSYQNVTECQTRQRNAGYWRTRYEPNPKATPCQYDGRPNLFGYLNRTGYSLRSAFSPSYIRRREYVPQVSTQVVPVTRRVAIRGTRQVTYNVAKMVPYTTTRKVAVNTTRYVDQEVVALRPVTVMRTVPIGTQTTYLYSPLATGHPRTVLQPSPDPLSDTKANKNSPERISNSRDKFDRDAFAPKREASEDNSDGRLPLRESSYKVPHPSNWNSTDQDRIESRSQPVQRRKIQTRRAPSIARVSGWRASRQMAGPKLIQPTISVAENQ